VSAATPDASLSWAPAKVRTDAMPDDDGAGEATPPTPGVLPDASSAPDRLPLPGDAPEGGEDR
jgi:hypothetical protein